MARGLGRLLKQLKTDDWLGRMIDEAHSRTEPERWVEPDITIHPSGAGGPCAREIELSYLGHRTAVNSVSRRRMDNGTWSHRRWNGYLREIGVLVVAEFRRSDVEPHVWSGELDVIVQNPFTGRLHIGEIKTMNSHRWARVPEQAVDRLEMMRILEQTEAKYCRQITQYIVKMKDQWGVDDEGIFIFENTDTQEFKVRYVVPDEDLKKRAFENAVTAQQAAIDGFLIDPPFKRKSPTCRSCYRERLCYDIQDGKEDVCQKVKQALQEVSGRSGQLSTTPLTF